MDDPQPHTQVSQVSDLASQPAHDAAWHANLEQALHQFLGFWPHLHREGEGALNQPSTLVLKWAYPHHSDSTGLDKALKSGSCLHLTV